MKFHIIYCKCIRKVSRYNKWSFIVITLLFSNFLNLSFTQLTLYRFNFIRSNTYPLLLTIPLVINIGYDKGYYPQYKKHQYFCYCIGFCKGYKYCLDGYNN